MLILTKHGEREKTNSRKERDREEDRILSNQNEPTNQNLNYLKKEAHINNKATENQMKSNYRCWMESRIQ